MGFVFSSDRNNPQVAELREYCKWCNEKFEAIGCTPLQCHIRGGCMYVHGGEFDFIGWADSFNQPLAKELWEGIRNKGEYLGLEVKIA